MICAFHAHFVRFLYDVINWAGVLINKLLRLLYGASFFPPKYNNNIYELLLAICLCLLVLFSFSLLSPSAFCSRSYARIFCCGMSTAIFFYLTLFFSASMCLSNGTTFYATVFIWLIFIRFLNLNTMCCLFPYFLYQTQNTPDSSIAAVAAFILSWSAHWISRWQQRAQKLYYLISIS